MQKTNFQLNNSCKISQAGEWLGLLNLNINFILLSNLDCCKRSEKVTWCTNVIKFNFFMTSFDIICTTSIVGPLNCLYNNQLWFTQSTLRLWQHKHLKQHVLFNQHTVYLVIISPWSYLSYTMHVVFNGKLCGKWHHNIILYNNIYSQEIFYP